MQNIRSKIYKAACRMERDRAVMEYGEFLEVIRGKLFERLKNVKAAEVETGWMKNWREAKERVRPRLVNAERNGELLAEVPHELFLDMAVLFYVLIPCVKNGSCGIVNVEWKNMERWGIGYEELKETAMENLRKYERVQKKTMVEINLEVLLEAGTETPLGRLADEMLEEREGERNIDEDMETIAVTTESGVFGAEIVLLPGVLERLAGQMGSDLFVIMESVSRFIVQPYRKYYSEEEVYESIQKTDSFLSGEKFLSDSVYLYRRETKEVEVLREKE